MYSTTFDATILGDGGNVSVASTNGGGNFESLVTSDTATVDIDYQPIDESYSPAISAVNLSGSVVTDDLFDAGGDGFGSVTISKNFNFDLSSGGESLVYSNEVNGSLLATKETTGTTVFTVVANNSSGDIDYTFTLSQPIQLASTTTFDADVLSKGGNKDYYWLKADGTMTVSSVPADIPIDALVEVRAKKDNGTYGTVNGNNAGMGASAETSSQTVSDGEWVELNYITAQSSLSVGVVAGSSGKAFAATETFEVKLNGSSTVYTFDGADLVNGKLELHASDYSLPSISSIEIGASASGPDLIINSVSTSSVTAVDGEVLEFTYTGSDLDGDAVSGDFAVAIDAGSSSSLIDSTGFLFEGTGSGDSLIGSADGDIIYGYSGDDTLVGGSGHDVLIGGSGNDQLTGGSGADEFAFEPSQSGGTDTVVDFNAAEGDVLDLSDLLVGETDATIDNYLVASFDNSTGSTTIEVYQGDANVSGATSIQTIVVNGDVSDLTSLINNGNLDVDN